MCQHLIWNSSIWGQNNTHALLKVHLRELLGSSFCIQVHIVHRFVYKTWRFCKDRQFWALAYCLVKLRGLSDCPIPTQIAVAVVYNSAIRKFSSTVVWNELLFTDRWLSEALQQGRIVLIKEGLLHNFCTFILHLLYYCLCICWWLKQRFVKKNDHFFIMIFFFLISTKYQFCLKKYWYWPFSNPYLLKYSSCSEVQGVMLVAQSRAVVAIELTEPASVFLNSWVFLHKHRFGDIRLVVPDHHISFKL